MHYYRDLINIPTGCVATIGNFDGVHVGHQKILQRVKEEAHLVGLPSVAIIFEPQPLEYFMQDKAAPRLMNVREKLEAFAVYDIDMVFCLRFTTRLAELTAEEFITRVLLAQLRCKHIVVGDDFSFGSHRTGGYELLSIYDEFRTEEVAEIEVGTHRVSSSMVRQTLAVSDFALAAKLLGRPYSMSGHVAHGDKRGRELGFPTANIFLRHKVLPLNGVFVVRVWGLEQEPLLAVANVGNRPTVSGERNQLEVHILNFDQDIYMRKIRVEFLQKIREEEKFASLTKLTQQIAIDTKKAKAYE